MVLPLETMWFVCFPRLIHDLENRVYYVYRCKVCEHMQQFGCKTGPLNRLTIWYKIGCQKSFAFVATSANSPWQY